MTDNIKFLFGSDDVHRLATLTATTEGSGLPIENTQNGYRGYPWRSTSIATHTITGTLATDYQATDLIINKHNLTSAATIQLVLKDGGSGGTTQYDSGEVEFTELIELGVFEFGVDPWGGEYSEPWGLKALQLSFTQATFDYYEITIKDGANGDGYLQAGQILLGNSFTPANNFSRGGAVLDYQDGTQLTRTDGGSLRAETLSETYRRLTVSLDWMEPSDRTELISKVGRAGRGVDIFVSAYPNEGGLKEAHYSFVAKRANSLRVSERRDAPNYDQTKLILDEV